jgi:RimJ/RimL family protein N-acetyltransferase
MSIMLPCNDSVCLTEFRWDDRELLALYLNDRGIYEHTLRIPYPYTLDDADFFLRLQIERPTADEPLSIFAVRMTDGPIVGGCGLEPLAEDPAQKAVIGYWLARPFWGQGWMTAAVRTLCRHGFETLGLHKITATVFVENLASMRVLEKVGFRREGCLRDHMLKDGQYRDSAYFGLLVGELMDS